MYKLKHLIAVFPLPEESHTCPRAEEYGTTEEERNGECNCCENCTIDCQLDI